VYDPKAKAGEVTVQMGSLGPIKLKTTNPVVVDSAGEESDTG